MKVLKALAAFLLLAALGFLILGAGFSFGAAVILTAARLWKL